MKADYAPAAEHDLEQAVDNFLLVSTSAATDFGNLVDASVAALLEFPELGRRGPGGKRTLVLGRSGYRMVYAVRGDLIVILRLENLRRVKR